MSINLSVVGVFFGKDLPKLDADTPVLKVLEEAKRAASAGELRTKANPGKGETADVELFDFALTKNPTKLAVHSFTVKYGHPIIGRDVNGHYESGTYFLEENLTAKPAYRVWQYYVLNSDGKSVTDGKVRFLNEVDFKVPVGGSLIWRLVSILVGRNSPPPQSVAGRTLY